VDRKKGDVTAILQYNYLQQPRYILLRHDISGLLDQVMHFFVSIYLLCLLGGLLSGVLVTKHIFKPVMELSRATQKVMEGDFTALVPVSGKLHKGDINQLIQNFNRMVSQLNQIQLLNNNFMSFFTHELRGLYLHNRVYSAFGKKTAA
jgi:two-component system OmpR family sensor kinase